MREIEQVRTPGGKLKILVRAADLVIECINKFYEVRNMQITLQTLDADQVLSIFCYIVIRSQLKELYTHLNVIEHFSGEGQLRSETGYYYSVLCMSLESLRNVEL